MIVPRTLRPQLLFFREHWKTYRRNLHETWGGQSKKSRLIPAVLWRLHGDDIENAWLGMRSIVMDAPTYTSLRKLVRLQTIQRQRRLVVSGHMEEGVSILDQVDDDQLYGFITLASSRVDRLSSPSRETGLLRRLLHALGIAKYDRPDMPLRIPGVVTIGLSGVVCGRIGGHRPTIRRINGLGRPIRLPHPMRPRVTPKEAIIAVWNYFQGARVFLWISAILGKRICTEINSLIQYQYWQRIENRPIIWVD